MNYLGHAFLSFGIEEILVGNMIADHVKGSHALDALPAGVATGIRLHRHIDAFADEHPATLRGKLFFREEYGLYSGPIMDTLYDHFLANDPRYFASADALRQFSAGVYDTLAVNADVLPVSFAAYFPNMQQNDWLANYRSLKGIERSLQGLAHRAKYMADPGLAYQAFVTGYYHLNQCYYELIDDMVKYVRSELQMGGR